MIAKEVITNHSKQFGVSESDSRNFILSAAFSLKSVLKKSKIDFENLDEETQMMFFSVALENSSKKLKEFINQYRSYPHKREALQKYILELLKK